MQSDCESHKRGLHSTIILTAQAPEAVMSVLQCVYKQQGVSPEFWGKERSSTAPRCQHQPCESVTMCVQAERDARRYAAFERKAGLTSQAERLKSSMKESQLVNFRAETKSR